MLFFYGTFINSLIAFQREEQENNLLAAVNIIAGNISDSDYFTSKGISPVLEPSLDQKSKEEQYRIMLIDESGRVLYDSNQTDKGKFYQVPEVIEAFQKNNKVSTRTDEMATYAASAVTNEKSEKVCAVLLISPIEEIYQYVKELRQRMLLFILVTVLVLGVLVFFFSKFMLDPMKSILKTVQKMSDGHLGQRIRLKGYNEFSQLGKAFNNMSEKLEQVEKTRDEFVSNVSHELKTPLSSIKVLTESILLEENVPIEMYREFLQDINSEIDRMTNIVNDLLALVRLDQGEDALHIKTVEINRMVEDILKRLSPLAEQKKISLLYEDVRQVMADVDEMKLSLAISNVVENGIKYTPNGGTVKVIVDADHQNVFVTVQDTGIGMSEENQSKVFGRFYRVDKTRDRETGGTGLGLSITHSTVLLHNGSIRLTSKEGEGSTFLIRLPIHYNR